MLNETLVALQCTLPQQWLEVSQKRGVGHAVLAGILQTCLETYSFSYCVMAGIHALHQYASAYSQDVTFCSIQSTADEAIQDVEDSAPLVDKLAAAVQSRADWQETANTLRQQADSLDVTDCYDAHMEMGTFLASRFVLPKERCMFAMAQLCLTGISNTDSGLQSSVCICRSCAASRRPVTPNKRWVS